MSKVIVSKSKIEAVADNIRNAIGSADKLTLEQMANANLSSGGGANTSDATATASDILLGKTAYVSNGKVEGTIATYEGAFEGSAVNELDALMNGSISGEITTYASTIRENGFSCLPNIIGINAPNLTSSNSYSFSKCTSLVNVNMPLLTNVGWGGFDGCSAIKELRLPCLLRATNYSFQNCTSLTDIYSGYDGYISLGNVNSFNGCNTIKLHVKSAYASGYASQTNWSNLINEGKVIFIGDYE